MSPSSMSEPSGDAGSVPEEFAARVLGESIYDRVTSFLMAVVLGAMMIVGLMGVIYITNQAYACRVTAPLQIIEVSGGGGGSLEGTPGSIEKIDAPGADAGPLASNNEERSGRLRGAGGPGDAGDDDRCGGRGRIESGRG